MMVYLRKMRGIILIGLIWILPWVVLFHTLLVAIIVIIHPQGDSDVGTLRMSVIIGWVGFLSGCFSGFLMSVAENGKALRNLSLRRAALWGILGSSIFPIMTGREDQVFWTCPFGAIIGVALVALARKAARRDSSQSRRLRDIVFALSLMAVRDAVNPVSENSMRP